MTESIQQPFNAGEEWLARPRRLTASRPSRGPGWRLGNFENLYSCIFLYILLHPITSYSLPPSQGLGRTPLHDQPSSAISFAKDSTFLYSSLLFSTFLYFSLLFTFLRFSIFINVLHPAAPDNLTSPRPYDEMSARRHFPALNRIGRPPLTNSNRSLIPVSAQLRHLRDIHCRNRGGNRPAAWGTMLVDE